MPRPLKLGFDYFSLDTDFFENKTINALRRAHGSIGVLVYLNLLCRIYKEGYYFKFKSLEELSMDIAEEISSAQVRRTAARVTETITYLVESRILDESLFKQSLISGTKIQEQYVLMAYKAKRNIKLGVHALVDVNLVIRNFKVNSEKTRVNSEETAVNSEFSTQSNSNNTTTTITSIERACAREDREPDKSPDVCEIAAVFSHEFYMPRAEAYMEASRFYDYNEARGWDCLPHWRVAAVRWNEQKINKEIEEDSK